MSKFFCLSKKVGELPKCLLLNHGNAKEMRLVYLCLPSKTLIFAWRVLINKIATRDALLRKGVLRDDADKCCVLCLDEKMRLLSIFFFALQSGKNCMAECLFLAGRSFGGRGGYSGSLYGVWEDD